MTESGLFDLKGRVAMVTGAGQGVGRGIALTLAAYGAGGIVVNDFHADRAAAVVAEIETLGVRATAMVADVGNLAQVRAAVEAAEAALGPIEILVNNAGNGGPEGFPPEMPLFWETDPARWYRFLHVNLFGVMNCCHTVLPGMVARCYGRVVTITSDAARSLEPRQADYAAAKAGAAGFMRGLAGDAARFGVTANCIAIATIRPVMPPAELEAFLASDRTKAQLARYPIRRFGLPEDIAGTALLLCSDAAAWITGQTYPVNGGYSAAL
ncbi:glucose 1-dehydrogenase [Acidocella aquatica]|uniref:Glucose 1-dehydrogenase n=1 Tax=Acidocella aquatica TaxID=1922313 RepID=A0ABQ6A8M9_9PROT|nr:SDR family oxidoreductase [Acidocella aquatica]GLR68261.1 glucose 1-dehydrogenase [Acidocella aquatica]